MKISVIGCGYVGIVTGACLANSGNEIYFYDEDTKNLVAKRFGERARRKFK